MNNPAQEQMPASTSTPGVTKHEKIRTPLAKIIVGESFGKPYYEIMWFSLDYEKCDIGYGSFSLDIVRDYLKDEFEIIEQDSAHDVAPVVRCEKCLYRSQYANEDGFYQCGMLQCADEHCALVPPNFACIAGVRRGAKMDGGNEVEREL